MPPLNTTSISPLSTRPNASDSCFVHDTAETRTGRLWGYILIFLISVVCNSLVTHSALKDTIIRKTVNHLVANVCIANLLLTIVYMPRMMIMVTRGSEWLVGGTAGLALCKMVPVIHHVCILVSILSLMILSIDRYLSIVYPTGNVLERRLNYLIAFMWVVAIAARIPTLYALQIEEHSKGKFNCGVRLIKAFNSEDARDTYYTFLLVTCYALPLVTMVVFYIVVFCYLRRKETVDARCIDDPTREARFRAARNSILVMLVCASVTFVICWVTYFAAQIAYDNVPCGLRFWRFFLAHCNSAISPCLFLAFNRGYRELVGRAFIYTCCTLCEIAEDDENDDDHERGREREDKVPGPEMISIRKLDKHNL
ncbi:predicted protein [Nematostella vectensis]|uniref:G-protein coupled receptors family 1 profile domain-containing protein n=1 Tax=Nematostella vectensis TaxID=45351 RepID=A7S1R7_NEMVE|nr:substance-K receptor [Nematostella vectensis]EDO42415.1 predicted protein [Nematostella vectensis]|eukprot:XP_001634478.1 predicted protein [Nematostella vectensis]